MKKKQHGLRPDDYEPYSVWEENIGLNKQELLDKYPDRLSLEEMEWDEACLFMSINLRQGSVTCLLDEEGICYQCLFFESKCGLFKRLRSFFLNAFR